MFLSRSGSIKKENNLLKEISVILPTYNEAGHIVELIKEICLVIEGAAFVPEIILVDDNSPDGTAGTVREFFKDDCRIKVYVREKERGLASAIKFGIEKAAKENLVFMDSDFNHDPRIIPVLIKQLASFDIVVGSRFVAGGGMKGSQFRYWGSYLFNVFIKLILRIKTNDNLSGFFVISKQLIKSFNLEQIFKGYGDYFIRFLEQAGKRGLSIIEIPTVYQERPSGKSKTNFLWHLLRYTKTVFQLRFGKKGQDPQLQTNNG